MNTLCYLREMKIPIKYQNRSILTICWEWTPRNSKICSMPHSTGKFRTRIQSFLFPTDNISGGKMGNGANGMSFNDVWKFFGSWLRRNTYKTNDIHLHWENSKMIICTCCTSAVVLRNNSIYRVPIISLCLSRACAASFSVLTMTNASPVLRPSG